MRLAGLHAARIFGAAEVEAVERHALGEVVFSVVESHAEDRARQLGRALEPAESVRAGTEGVELACGGLLAPAESWAGREQAALDQHVECC